jgi:hypothetical protein
MASISKKKKGIFPKKTKIRAGKGSRNPKRKPTGRRKKWAYKAPKLAHGKRPFLKLKLLRKTLEKSKIKAIKKEAPNVCHDVRINDFVKRICENCKETDYDRVLNEIDKRGKVAAIDLRNELGIPEKQFTECYTILKKNGEIKVEYPIFGKMQLVRVKKTDGQSRYQN